MSFEKLIIKYDKQFIAAEINQASNDIQVVPCDTYIQAVGNQGTNGVSNTTEYYDDIINQWTKSIWMIEW